MHSGLVDSTPRKCFHYFRNKWDFPRFSPNFPIKNLFRMQLHERSSPLDICPPFCLYFPPQNFFIRNNFSGIFLTTSSRCGAQATFLLPKASRNTCARWFRYGALLFSIHNQEPKCLFSSFEKIQLLTTANHPIHNISFDIVLQRKKRVHPFNPTHFAFKLQV